MFATTMGHGPSGETSSVTLSRGQARRWRNPFQRRPPYKTSLLFFLSFFPAVISVFLPNDEVEEVAFLPPIDELLAGLIHPPNHLHIRGRIIRHEMNDISDRSGREKLVETDKNCGTLCSDLIHLMIWEGFETASMKFSNLPLEILLRLRRP